MSIQVTPAYNGERKEVATFQLGTAKKNGKGIGNCVVLAVTACTGLPYEEVEQAMLTRGGYTEGRGTCTTLANVQDALKPLGFHVDRTIYNFYGGSSSTTELNADGKTHRETNTKTPKTFGQLAKTQKGAWLVCNAGHGVAILDGELVDNGYHIPATPEYSRAWGKRRSLKVAFRIVKTDRREFISRQVSTSNPGTQTSLF